MLQFILVCFFYLQCHADIFSELYIRLFSSSYQQNLILIRYSACALSIGLKSVQRVRHWSVQLSITAVCGLLSTSPSLLQCVPAHILYPQRSCAVTSYAPAMMGSRASAGEFLSTPIKSQKPAVSFQQGRRKLS